jgi:hypothetical protein
VYDYTRHRCLSIAGWINLSITHSTLWNSMLSVLLLNVVYVVSQISPLCWMSWRRHIDIGKVFLRKIGKLSSIAMVLVTIPVVATLNLRPRCSLYSSIGTATVCGGCFKLFQCENHFSSLFLQAVPGHCLWSVCGGCFKLFQCEYPFSSKLFQATVCWGCFKLFQCENHFSSLLCNKNFCSRLQSLHLGTSSQGHLLAKIGTR